MSPEQKRHASARLSFASLTLTIAFTSVRHLFRFGPPALLFNLISVVLLLLLLWYRSTRRALAVWTYALLGAWIVTGFGLVDGLWKGTLAVYGNYFFPHWGVFYRSAPRPYGFEAAGILTSVASFFALYHGCRFLQATLENAPAAGPTATRRSPLLYIPFAIIVAGTGLGVWRGSPAAVADDVIRIGVIVPTRGPAAPLGQAFVRAVELAKEDRTTRRRYELVIGESGTTPQETRAAIEGLIYDKRVRAVVGGISLSGQVVKPYTTAEGIPHLCVCSVRTIGDGVFNFTNIPLPEDEAIGWVNEARRRGARTVAMLAQEYPSIDGHIEALAREAATSGLRIVYKRRFPASSSDFRIMIDEARQTNPDIYMVEAFNPALDLLGQQLRLAGVRNVASIVALAISDRPDLFEGAWYTDSYVDESLQARFEARYPDTRFVAHMIPYAYDSLNILLDGFESGTPIADYVRGITRHQGAAGIITRTPGTGNFRSSPAVWVIADGKRRISRDSSEEGDGLRLRPAQRAER
jgi:ABC-type branched-subunit amino acid transport system substrate-binding protein